MIQTSPVDRRYARALVRLSKNDAAKAESWKSVLSTIAELFEGKDASKVLYSPVMPVDLKQSLLDYALKQSNADDSMKHFVKKVVDAGRVMNLPGIHLAFSTMLADIAGEATAAVESAVELQTQELDEIASIIKTKLTNIKKVNIEQIVNPEILGGLVIKIGNTKIDMSLSTRLNLLAQSAVN